MNDTVFKVYAVGHLSVDSTFYKEINKIFQNKTDNKIISNKNKILLILNRRNINTKQFS